MLLSFFDFTKLSINNYFRRIPHRLFSSKHMESFVKSIKGGKLMTLFMYILSLCMVIDIIRTLFKGGKDNE